jgi:cytochrome c553
MTRALRFPARYPTSPGSSGGVHANATACRASGAIGLVLVLIAGVVPLKSLASDIVEEELNSALRDRPSLLHGQALFNDTCIACHGPDGGGQPNGSVPAIAAQPSHFIIRQLVDYRHGRRLDLRMEHSTGRHRLVDAQDIADVAAYVSQLPPTRAADVGAGNQLLEAQSIYERACAPCHGDSGAGDASSAVPRLAGQHFSYLVRQMHNVTADRGGQRPTFPREHTMLLQRFDDADLIDLADYLSRLGQAGNATPQPDVSGTGGQR